MPPGRSLILSLRLFAGGVEEAVVGCSDSDVVLCRPQQKGSAAQDERRTR